MIAIETCLPLSNPTRNVIIFQEVSLEDLHLLKHIISNLNRRNLIDSFDEEKKTIYFDRNNAHDICKKISETLGSLVRLEFSDEMIAETKLEYM